MACNCEHNQEAITYNLETLENFRQLFIKRMTVDSEHSAIFQCLQGQPTNRALKRIILTASGGPFFGKTREELSKVTVADALKHPNWSMGQKITIDSATMMNKGLELIEAVWLFDVSPDMIDIVVHRESIIHSMVEFQDGSIMAQMAAPNMKIPIQYAAFTLAEVTAQPTKFLRELQVTLGHTQHTHYHKQDLIL